MRRAVHLIFLSLIREVGAGGDAREGGCQRSTLANSTKRVSIFFSGAGTKFPDWFGVVWLKEMVNSTFESKSWKL